MSLSRDFCIVVGLGKSGLSLARYLTKQCIPFAMMDTRENPANLSAFKTQYPDVEVRCGDLDGDFLCRAHTVYVSPGISLQLPALQKAKVHGVRLSGDIDLFSQLATAPIVAITGSNGKSTVTTLVGEMAKTAGIKVAVGGNLGEPALDLLDDHIQLYVMELSSFQLETCERLNAEVATVLNVSEDHMDRYDSFQDYTKAKHRIFDGAKQIVVNLDDPLSLPDQKVSVKQWTFSVNSLVNDALFRLSKIEEVEWIFFEDTPLVSTAQLRIVGRHNWANALASLALGYAVGISFKAMVETLTRFTGLAHRCQWIREHKGITYFNDSKGTNVGATLAAIDGIGSDEYKIVLIAGGAGKGADFSSLAEPISRYCRAVVLLGKDAALIERALKPSTVCIFVQSIEEAVDQASRLAVQGDIVLLSPACTSLDMFKNFEERGSVFIDAVERLQ